MVQNRKIIGIASFLILAVFIVGCQTTGNLKHAVLMKGSIVDWEGSDAIVCIGTNDGATVGQQLKVYKIESVNTRDKELSRTFRKVRTGEVKILEVFDEHFAKASIISGEAKTGNLVELN